MRHPLYFRVLRDDFKSWIQPRLNLTAAHCAEVAQATKRHRLRYAVRAAFLLVPPIGARRGLYAEARPASAVGRRVRIVDLERSADQFAGIVNFRSAEKLEAHFVNDDPCAVAFDQQVVIIPLIGKLEAVGKAGAAATVHGNAEQALNALFGHNRVDLLGSRFAHGDRCSFCGGQSHKLYIARESLFKKALTKG